MELGRKGYVQRENELGRRPRELGNQVGKTSKSRAARKNAGRPSDCQDGVENPERDGLKANWRKRVRLGGGWGCGVGESIKPHWELNSVLCDNLEG